uniref:xanthine dehydrogenase n=1 Tax=Steinernema glaseri TaxID=37863 RepID=A0A1I7XZV4_9BILA
MGPRSDQKVPHGGDVATFDEHVLTFFVNGRRIEERDIDPRTTLATYLRDHLRLTGTKIGCNEGGCGACTVMISDLDPLTEKIRHYSANACLTPVCAVFGKAVTTVEGIGSTVSKRLHPVQQRLSEAHGSQCGFCTPGFVMAMYALLRNNPRPTQNDIDESIQGNLCRCTGYRPILEAFYSFACDAEGNVKVTEEQNGVCAMGENCCKVKKNGSNGTVPKENGVSNGDSNEAAIKINGMNGVDSAGKEMLKLSDMSKFPPYDPSQELIFPPELKAFRWHKKSFSLESDGIVWYQPTNWDDLLRIKRRHPYSRFISGNSELAIELKFRFIDLPIAINPKQVPILREHRIDETRGIYLGMGLSLTEMKDILNGYIGELPEWKTAVFRSICAMLHYFAGKHVRNTASVAGNIATASPISDLNPIWMASGAQVVVASEERGERVVTVDDRFFVGYRRTILDADEILKGIWIPFSVRNQYFRAYKQAQRREDDIAIVTSAFSAIVDPETREVECLSIAFGGMAPTTKLALETVKNLQGRKWNGEFLEDVVARIGKEFALPPGVPGGMSRYRQALTQSFFFKFFVHVGEHLKLVDCDFDHSGIETPVGEPKLPKLIATQIYQQVPVDQPEEDPVRRPIMHQSGKKHVTGEAIYCNDINVADCLHMAFVMSPVASGVIRSVDISECRKVPGFIAYFDHKDISEGVVIGHGDTPVFAKEKVTYHGQPVGALVATTHETARRAAFLAKVDVTPTVPIVTIEDAVSSGTYIDSPFKIHSSLNEGDTVKVTDWSSYDRVVEGSIRMGGQEHFYLETQQCIAIPGEDDEMEIISSTQSTNDVQTDVCKVLDVARHKVVVKVKRIGGGFGGKESCCGIFAAPAALAAQKLRKPVRITMERFDDMAISGTRHPFRFDYKVAVDKMGNLLDYSITALCNSGYTRDLSAGVLQRAMVHIDNVYRFGNADIYGRMCRTNLASNTAFRGFGGPQGMFATETIMKHVAETYGFDVDDFRYQNMYNEGDCTPFGMHLRQCNVKRTWEECIELSDYYRRLEVVKTFNSRNKYRKRGLYVLPTRFGIGFGLKQLNQAGALVHIYTDGSVLVSHGGMEMGQGLHTKMIQVTARCLGIDISLVHISDTSCDKVPNASATAASVGSDMNGLAVQDACEKLNARLKPFKEANPEGSWKDWVLAAYVARVSLSSTGFGIIHSETVDFLNGKGAELFGYCVYGTACSEVEVDCLTGDHHLIRTDIVMDIGDSLNPAIDIGQIEGAFIQGYGLFTMEEIKIRPNGIRLTRGPGNYKIPSADDAPRQFHVKLLKGSSNRMGIFSSKAVGEPPLFLGCSVFFAIREAIRAYREQNGHHGYFVFDSPATPEKIRMACEDHITQQIAALPESTTYDPWTVPL